MKLKLILSVSVVCLLLSGSSFAATYYVDEVTGSNVEDHQLDTLENLLRSELLAHPQARLGLEGEGWPLRANLVRLQRSYLLTLDLVDEKEGRSRKAKLKTYDEVDVAVERLVAAIVEDVSVERTASRGRVLKSERDEPARFHSIGGYSFALGPAVSFTDAMDSEKMMYALAFAYIWDVSNFLLELRTDINVGYNEATLGAYNFAVGGHFVWLNQRQWAVYSGIDLGIAHLEDGGFDGTTGFSFAGNTGIVLLRHADINVDIRTRVMVVANKFNGDVPVIGSLLVGLRF